MSRNQKIARQPWKWTSRPPIRGPKVGPRFEPRAAIPMYLPRSDRVETSDTTPFDKDIFPLLPLLCIILRINNAT